MASNVAIIIQFRREFSASLSQKCVQARHGRTARAAANLHGMLLA
jgi:hypothetical protein